MAQKPNTIEESGILIPNEIKQAFWNQLTSYVPEGYDNVLPLGVYTLCKRFTHMEDIGVKTVIANQIRGCVGLSNDFDKSIMQRQQSLQNFSASEEFFQTANSAITTLLKIENIYFVLGGQDCIPIASIHNQEPIQAHIIEVLENEI